MICCNELLYSGFVKAIILFAGHQKVTAVVYKVIKNS